MQWGHHLNTFSKSCRICRSLTEACAWVCKTLRGERIGECIKNEIFPKPCSTSTFSNWFPIIFFFYSFFTIISFVYKYRSNPARKLKNILFPLKQPIWQLQHKSLQNWMHPHSQMPVPSLQADKSTNSALLKISIRVSKSAIPICTSMQEAPAPAPAAAFCNSQKLALNSSIRTQISSDDYITFSIKRPALSF